MKINYRKIKNRKFNKKRIKKTIKEEKKKIQKLDVKIEKKIEKLDKKIMKQKNNKTKKVNKKDLIEIVNLENEQQRLEYKVKSLVEMIDEYEKMENDMMGILNQPGEK
jgi:hypothetical protein